MKGKTDSARVLLVSANREEINMATWPLGAACVAAATIQAGHEVSVLDLMHVADPYAALEKAVRDFNPEVIGVSVRNIDDQSMMKTAFFLDNVRNLITRCRNLSTAPIVLGGAGYSIFPESALKYLGADMGIAGEGESALPQLVERIKSGLNCSGPYVLYRSGSRPKGKRRFARNLDQFPLPDIGLVPLDAYAAGDFWMPVQTRRGCSLACSYCSTPAIEGLKLRKRSPEAVVRWLAGCVDAGIRKFHFVDNTFNLPSSYAKKLCSLIIQERLDITWRCILYPWKMDEKLAELMAHAGCREASIGSESGSEDMLRSMNKRFTPGDVKRTAEMTARTGIQRMGFLMFGGPGETLASANESLRFADSLNLDSLKITIGIRIYPGTALSHKAVEDGIINQNDDLLMPRFYMVPGLEEPLRELIGKWKSGRPNWSL
jgi:radical SAM superfamily enzyme YgiQ (UPF0313 family)